MTVSTGAQYTIEAGDAHGITLDDVIAFIGQVEQFDPAVMNSALWCSTWGADLKTLQRLQVRGGIPAAPVKQELGTSGISYVRHADRCDHLSYPETYAMLGKVKATVVEWTRDETDARTAMSMICTDLRVDRYPHMRQRTPAEQETSSETAPASDELLAENEALHYRLDRIRKHYDDWDANALSQGDLRERVEQELKGHAPAAAGISQSESGMVALYLGQWRAGELAAVRALENIEGLLGLRPLPDEED